MLAPDLSVSLHQRRLRCVLDLGLMLSPWGPMVVKQLSGLLELWAVRELWHILDNTECYRSDRGFWVLGTWEQVRLQSDLGGLRLHWLGDGPQESFLPEDLDAGLFARFQSLVEALDPLPGETDPLRAGTRDALALAAALGEAVILAAGGPERADAPPFVELARSWGIAGVEVPPQDPLAAIETELLSWILLQSGSAQILWSGLELAAVRVAAPRAWPVFAQEPSERSEPTPPAHPWQDVQLFWHWIYPMRTLAAPRGSAARPSLAAPAPLAGSRTHAQ